MRSRFVSRGGEKLDAALDYFQLSVCGLICADLGSHVGGFVDCLLQRGAGRVHAVDTAYGILAWRLRRNPGVVVWERTNAIYFQPAELLDVVTIDVGWTKQGVILPTVAGWMDSSRSAAYVVTLIKPHYEAPRERLNHGVLDEESCSRTVDEVLVGVRNSGWAVRGTFHSPLRGHGGNQEVFALLTRPIGC
jgi:23S rRNA (cytidine1920-2'-O)/16S rRNA (cytidine1409-2'-O)-methyltransferase